MKKKTAGRIIGAKLSFSNKITKILDKYGNQKIRSIYIGRRPINSLVEKAFNIISLGKWSKLRDQYYYDKLFHLFLIIQMDDDTVISFEKNSIVTMTEDDVRCSTKDTECVKLDYPTDSITLDDLVRKPLERIGKEKYFIYDPFKQNCQIFIRAVLETFGLYNKKVDDFVYQDITDIVKELPWYVKYVAKGVTDLDATVSKVTGAGKDPEPDKQEDLEILTNFVTEMLQSK
tara:strand:- start:1787 stop:2479 length:693 start_codon:yes stop_codon:yes gene_type:complete